MLPDADTKDPCGGFLQYFLEISPDTDANQCKFATLCDNNILLVTVCEIINSRSPLFAQLNSNSRYNGGKKAIRQCSKTHLGYASNILAHVKEISDKKRTDDDTHSDNLPNTDLDGPVDSIAAPHICDNDFAGLLDRADDEEEAEKPKGVVTITQGKFRFFLKVRITFTCNQRQIHRMLS